MKVRYLIVSTMLLMAMLLAACGTGFPTATSLPGTEPPTTETVVPGSSTSEASTPEATTSTTGTETPGVVPVTGGVNPASLSTMMKMCVFDKDGNQIGKVGDLILDLDSLRVAYVVVGTGGFLSLGEKHVAVPYNQLKIQEQTAGAGCDLGSALQADTNSFKNAPEINLGQDLPALGQPASPDWDGKFRSFWEGGAAGSSSSAATATPGTTEPPAASTETPAAATETPAQGNPQGALQGVKLQGVMLASDLLGLNFSLPAQQDATVTIDDALLDAQSGKLQYVVIHTSLNNNEMWIPVPFNMLTIDVPSHTLILDVDAATLQQAPTFAGGQYPDMSAAGWDSDIASFWKSHAPKP